MTDHGRTREKRETFFQSGAVVVDCATCGGTDSGSDGRNGGYGDGFKCRGGGDIGRLSGGYGEHADHQYFCGGRDRWSGGLVAVSGAEGQGEGVSGGGPAALDYGTDCSRNDVALPDFQKTVSLDSVR